jgi:hypothetical protein
MIVVKFDRALRRYRKGAFTDHDVTRCTGLSVRAWRELIKIGAVRIVTEDRGPGRVRLCDANTFKRAAVIAALNRARFSLTVSGRIAFFLPCEELFYKIWDPFMFQRNADVNPSTGLPPREEPPKTDWFDPDQPAKADLEHDLKIEIYNGRFVGIACGADHEHQPAIYGDLRNEGTRFVSWVPFHEQFHIVSSAAAEIPQALPHQVVRAIPKWAPPAELSDQVDPKFLDHQYEDHSSDGDPLALAAADAARSPLFKTTVNVALVVRKALRRYLGIEPAPRL